MASITVEATDRLAGAAERIAQWRRTLAAFVSAMVVSAVVWGAVVLFDVH